MAEEIQGQTNQISENITGETNEKPINFSTKQDSGLERPYSEKLIIPSSEDLINEN